VSHCTCEVFHLVPDLLFRCPLPFVLVAVLTLKTLHIMHTATRDRRAHRSEDPEVIQREQHTSFMLTVGARAVDARTSLHARRCSARNMCCVTHST
jgi:hypothetical protein